MLVKREVSLGKDTYMYRKSKKLYTYPYLCIGNQLIYT